MQGNLKCIYEGLKGVGGGGVPEIKSAMYQHLYTYFCVLFLKSKIYFRVSWFVKSDQRKMIYFMKATFMFVFFFFYFFGKIILVDSYKVRNKPGIKIGSKNKMLHF